jgi:hypothetical protein
MNAGEWIAFSAMMLTIMGGGLTIAIWIMRTINDIGTRLTVLETTIRLALPELGSGYKFEGGRLRRV